MKNNNIKPKDKKRGNAKNQIPSFLLKLYQILENKEYEKIIYWGDTGKYFVVKSLSEFSEKVLPKYFKHNNFASFVRQLNMYDFHKNRNSINENLFYHKLFIRGQKNLLKMIKRKTNSNEVSHFNYNNCNCILDPKSNKKNSMDNVLAMMKKVEDISKSYEECEKKIQLLTQKNEEITTQNHAIIQEIYKKNDYSKKLETLLFFIIEMFFPKNLLHNIFNSSEEAKKYQNMIKSDTTDSNTNFSNETFKPAEEFNANIFKNNFSEAFFQNIYDKLREILQNNHINQRYTKPDQVQYPMLLSDNKLTETTEKHEERLFLKSHPVSPNPYEEAQKIFNSNPPLGLSNKEEKYNFYRSPSFGQDLNNCNSSFLGRKTAKNNKENNNGSYSNEIFKISKPGEGRNNNFNMINEEEDIQKYLECNEKNEEANKISFDTNFLLDSDNLFDFNINNGNVSNSVNMTNNVNQALDKEFF